ncbi:MAG: hypothetical protein WDO73_34595 [Ignavibacteriota bacterium]
MGVLKGITEWATSPWGRSVPIHAAWFLIWVAGIAGLLFLIVHAIYVRYFARPEEFEGSVSPGGGRTVARGDPETLRGCAGVSLGDGRGDVDAALHGLPP